jgi:hypothetical protein
MPEWIVNLARRILGLGDGCWQIVLIVDGKDRRWIVSRMGSIEP